MPIILVSISFKVFMADVEVNRKNSFLSQYFNLLVQYETVIEAA